MIRRRILDFLTRMATSKRWFVLLSSLILTLLLGSLAGRLYIDPRWTSLLPDTIPVVKEYKKISENYLQSGDLIIAISGPDPLVLEGIVNQAEVLLTEKLQAPPEMDEETCLAEGRYIRHIYARQPEEWLRDNLLRLAKPNDARRFADIHHDPRLLEYLEHLNDDLEAEYSDTEAVRDKERETVGAMDAIHGFIATLERAARGETVDDATIRRIVRDLTIGRPYLFSLDNQMALIMVAPSTSSMNAAAMADMDRAVEEVLRPLDKHYPDYSIERTGIVPISRDELDSMGPQTLAITGFAFLIILIMLMCAFRSLLTPLITMLPIVIGIIWSMGCIYLTIGSVNIITSMIMVVLLGLGIDFSLHLTSRFHEEITAGKDVEEALRLTLGETGMGVITGAATTATAFLALMTAETRGVFEFGACAGMGVLITLLAVLWLLPSLLALYAIHIRREKPRSNEFKSLAALAGHVTRLRWPVAGMAALCVAGGLFAATKIEWEWNFMNLEPAGLRSVELQDEIIERFKFSITMSSVTVEGIEESRAIRKQLKTKGIVGEVDDISLWISRPDLDLRHIKRLQSMPDRPQPSLKDQAGPLAEELERLWANIIEIQALSITGGQDRIVEKSRQLVAERSTRDQGLLRRVADSFNGQLDWNSVGSFGARFSQTLGEQVALMARGEEPVTIDDLPLHIRARYTSQKQTGYLMQIYPRQNIFNREELEMFQGVVTAVHKNVTGFPQLMLTMNQTTYEEAGMASLLALALILFMLLLDFRRPLVALLAFMPLFCGIALTCGIMWLLGEKIHYINMIALPIIIGIGIDDGVHYFHRYLHAGRANIASAFSSVGRAILLTSLTTMIGFGSLNFYLMRGMASLGRVLFIGVGLCFIVTVILLPALASIFEHRLLGDKS